MKRIRRICKKLTFAFGTALLVVALLEILGRVLFWTAIPRDRAKAEIVTRALSDIDCTNPYLPYLRKSKAMGFLGRWECEDVQPVEPPKAANEIRILCCGASTTVDHPEYSQSWPGLLEKKLSEAFPENRIVMLVQAHGSYFTSDNLVFYMLRSQDYHPDLIVVYDGWNDLVPSYTADFRRDYSHSRGKPAPPQSHSWLLTTRSLEEYCPILNYSHFYQLVIQLLAQRESIAFNNSLYKTAGHPLNGYRGEETFRRNVETLARLGVQNGSRVILASQIAQTSPPYLGDRDSWLNTTVSGEHNRILKTIGANNPGCCFLDLAASFPQEPKYFVDCIHFSPEGSEVVASLFFDFLTSNDLIRQWNQSKPRCSVVFPFGELEKAVCVGKWAGQWPPPLVGIREGDVACAAITAGAVPAAPEESGLRIPLGFMPEGSYRLLYGVAYDGFNYDPDSTKGGGIRFRARVVSGGVNSLVTEDTLLPGRNCRPGSFVDIDRAFSVFDGRVELELTWARVGEEQNSHVAIRYPVIRLVE